MNPIDSFGPGAPGPPDDGARPSWARTVSAPVGRHGPAVVLRDRLGLATAALLLAAMAVRGLLVLLRGGA